MTRSGKLLRFAVVLVAAFHLSVLAWVFAHRLRYPYDLEWMEGGTLCHSLRLLDGKPIYAPPSLDFVPFLYTPLYPALLALLSKIFGLGYALGRAVSVASFVAATLLGYRFAARHSGSRAAAATAMTLPAAAFALTGAFYDLVRADSLWLFLSTGAVLSLYAAARDGDDNRRTGSDMARHLLCAAAAALLVLAFFAKQTASPLMPAAAVALLFLDAALLPTFILAMAAFGLPSLWWLNHASGGWFWRYVFETHQGHDFFAARAFVETPLALFNILGPSVLLVPWALLRRPSPSLAYAAWLAVAGVLTSCLGAGTQWAITNAYIPGVFFPSLAIALAAGRLVCARHEQVPRLRAPAVYALIGLSLLLKLPSVLAPAPARDDRATDVIRTLSRARLFQPFDPRRLLPTVADRAAGDQLIERLRTAGSDGKGEVMIPFHPFYAHLAGKRTYVHQMGVMDIGRAGLGVPLGLAEAIRGRRFSLVVVDDKIADKWAWWPGLREDYEDAGPAPAPRVYSGALTAPSLTLVPRRPTPAINAAPPTTSATAPTENAAPPTASAPSPTANAATPTTTAGAPTTTAATPTTTTATPTTTAATPTTNAATATTNAPSPAANPSPDPVLAAPPVRLTDPSRPLSSPAP